MGQVSIRLSKGASCEAKGGPKNLHFGGGGAPAGEVGEGDGGLDAPRGGLHADLRAAGAHRAALGGGGADVQPIGWPRL